MQFLADLERLEAFRGTMVPVSPLSGGALELLGPLLLPRFLPSTKQSIPWPTLRAALENWFGPLHQTGRIDRRKIGSGWAGLNAFLHAFRRMEAVTTEDESEELRRWLEGIEAAVIQQSTAHSNGSGDLEKVLASLNVPKAFVDLFTLPSDPAGGEPSVAKPSGEGCQGSTGNSRSKSHSRTSSRSSEEQESKRSRTSPTGDHNEIHPGRPSLVRRSPNPASLPSIMTQAQPQHFYPPMPAYAHRVGTPLSPMPVSPASLTSPYMYHHILQQQMQHPSYGYPPQMPAGPPSTTHPPASSSPVSLATSPASSYTSSVSIGGAPQVSPTSPRPPRQSADVTELVGRAIYFSQNRIANVSSIVDYIQTNYPEETRRHKTWEDLVRSQLNMSPLFVVTETGEGEGEGKRRGKLWAIKEGEEGRFAPRVHRKREEKDEEGDQAKGGETGTSG